MQTAVVRRYITSTRKHVLTLAHSVGSQKRGGARRVARAFGSSDELNLDPVMMIGLHIAKQHGRTVNRIDHNINLAVVEQIAKCCSACRNDLGEPGPPNGRHVFKSSTLAFWIRDVMKEQRSFSKRRAPVVLVHLRVSMAVHHEEIEPAIVVVIEKTVAPTDEWNRGSCNTCPVAHVREAAVPLIAVEHLVVVTEVGDQKIHAAVVFIASHGNAHLANLPTLPLHRHPPQV